jgi:hypothetical protein
MSSRRCARPWIEAKHRCQRIEGMNRAEESVDEVSQILQLEALHDVGIHSEFQPLGAITFRVLRRYDDQRHVAIRVVDLHKRHQFEPVDVGHVDIRDDQPPEPRGSRRSASKPFPTSTTFAGAESASSAAMSNERIVGESSTIRMRDTATLPLQERRRGVHASHPHSVSRRPRIFETYPRCLRDY